MKHYDIDIKTITEFEEEIKEYINFFILLFEKKRAEEFMIMDLFIKKNIIFNSLICLKIIQSQDNDINTILDCLNSEEINDVEINILSDVPNSIILQLFDYIEISSKGMKEYFYIEDNQFGRYDLFFKSLIYQIKLHYPDHLESNQSSIFNEPDFKSFIKPVSFEKRIELIYDKIVNDSILFCKCYEADNKDDEMCRDILHRDVKNSYKYLHHLEPSVDNQLKQEIKLFVNTYSNKKFDTEEFEKKSLFQKSRIALFNTLEFAKKTINDLLENEPCLNSKECLSVFNIYKELFENSKDKFKSSRKTSAFLQELRKTKMNYIMIYRDEYIYPFLYDLIVMSFIYTVTYKNYEKEFNNIQSFAKKVNDHKHKYLQRSSDSNYHYNEFTRCIELIPEEYKILDPSTILIKHYSEILDCEYNSIVNVMRQLRFEFSHLKQPTYNLPSHLINDKLDFDHDYFRKLSLYVI